MTITQQHNGSLHVTHIDDTGNYHSKVYYDYTCDEAIACFFEYLKDEGMPKSEIKELHEDHEFWEFVNFKYTSDELHEYIDAADDSGFVTCNFKGEVI